MFTNCTSLKEVYILNKLTTFTGNVFNNCTSLTTLVIPKTVTKFTYGSLSNISSLTYVYFEGSIEDWQNIQFTDNCSQVPVYYYSEEKPADTLNSYWHYVDGVPTIWNNN
jgi:hypothetical protein